MESISIIKCNPDNGLLTRLIFDEGLEIEGERVFVMNIDSCIVPGNDKKPYQISVSDLGSNRALEITRSAAEDIVNNHLNTAEKYKQQYIKQRFFSR